MSALPKPLQDALRTFAPPALTYAEQTAVIENQARRLAALREELNALLRLPFDVDLSTSNRLEDEDEVTADPAIVRKVIDEVIEDNMLLIAGRIEEQMRRVRVK